MVLVQGARHYWRDCERPHKCRGCGTWITRPARELVVGYGRMPRRFYCLDCGTNLKALDSLANAPK